MSEEDSRPGRLLVDEVGTVVFEGTSGCLRGWGIYKEMVVEEGVSGRHHRPVRVEESNRPNAEARRLLGKGWK